MNEHIPRPVQCMLLMANSPQVFAGHHFWQPELRKLRALGMMNEKSLTQKGWDFLRAKYARFLFTDENPQREGGDVGDVGGAP